MRSDLNPHDSSHSASDLRGAKIVLVLTLCLGGLLGARWLLIKRPWLAKRPSPKKNAFSVVANEPGFVPLTNDLFIPAKRSSLQPRLNVDTSGFGVFKSGEIQWRPDASLPEIAREWEGWTDRTIAKIDVQLQQSGLEWKRRLGMLLTKAGCHMAAGNPQTASAVLKETREALELADSEARNFGLATVIYFQGVAALRLGENDNCVLCRGESSCILPISPAAIHQNPEGSRQAIGYFTEYLEHFPDDIGVRWLLNIAHMTLGEHPDKVDPRFLVSLDHYRNSKADLGQFRDIGERAGVNRFNQSGGVIMEDFDNDGLLDLAVTTIDPTEALDLYRNSGTGVFENLSKNSPALAEQYGGLVCVQADYDNDGLIDIFIPRGAWLATPVRPTLLHNEGNFRFTDATAEAGVLTPLNSNAAAWADYDNDGQIDLFICCEKQAHRLYRNLGDGKFQDVAAPAGLTGDIAGFGKGCTWIDYDNDDFPDLFINQMNDQGQLFHNDRNGRFTDVSIEMGIDGPRRGFACWTWDYDNDGWLDIFATSYDYTLEDIVKGLIDKPHLRNSSKLFRNLNGKGFSDVTRDAGLDLVFAPMGCNFGDLNNDGFLDFYLGTGAPDLGLLIPNRMFTSVGGKRFVEVTGSAGVGHLQKGHAVACGDWDRDGNVDIFIQMGGAVDGDKFHNILFQNPGHDNNWLAVKLIGVKTNRAALGARIKIVTGGGEPLTVHRHVSPGGSFGSSPLEQTIGVGKATSIDLLEIHWPTSGETQQFRHVPINQAIEVTESSFDYKILQRNKVPQPPEVR